jgi:hypothetical protein
MYPLWLNIIIQFCVNPSPLTRGSINSSIAAVFFLPGMVRCYFFDTWGGASARGDVERGADRELHPTWDLQLLHGSSAHELLRFMVRLVWRCCSWDLILLICAGLVGSIVRRRFHETSRHSTALAFLLGYTYFILHKIFILAAAVQFFVSESLSIKSHIFLSSKSCVFTSIFISFSLSMPWESTFVGQPLSYFLLAKFFLFG